MMFFFQLPGCHYFLLSMRRGVAIHCSDCALRWIHSDEQNHGYVS